MNNPNLTNGELERRLGKKRMAEIKVLTKALKALREELQLWTLNEIDEAIEKHSRGEK